MRDLIPQINLDAETALCIAAGMKQMAASDDDIHQDELALIDKFIADAGTEAPEASDINLSLIHTDELKSVFLKSLAVVALADGTIRQEEKDLLASYVERLSYNASAEQVLEEVACAFLRTFKSNVIFREQVETIGRNLGLSEDAIQGVLSS